MEESGVITAYVPQTYPELDKYDQRNSLVLRGGEVVRDEFTSVVPAFGLSRFFLLSFLSFVSSLIGTC